MAELSAVFSGRAWAVSGLLFGVDGLFDSDGRPLGERRAPSAAKAHSAMLLEPAPYEDERKGLAMNVSALEQVQRHLKAVLEDIGAFHGLCPRGPPSWETMFLAVIDQLAAPIAHVLREGSAAVRVPAARAVGYKLAAGYFGALRRIFAAQAEAEAPDVSVESFLHFIHQRRLLVGGNEVCAGPPRLIEWTTRVFLEGGAGAQAAAEPARLQLATLLLRQVQLGLAWELFDGAAEAHLLRTYGRRMRARSPFLAAALSDRLEALGTSRECWAAAHRALPSAMERAALERAIDAHAGAVRLPTALVFEELARLREGALELETDVGAALAGHFATWLQVHARVHDLQSSFELELRRLLGRELLGPVEMSALMMGPPRALRWLEAGLGHALVVEEGPPRRLLLSNARRTVPLSGT